MPRPSSNSRRSNRIVRRSENRRGSRRPASSPESEFDAEARMVMNEDDGIADIGRIDNNVEGQEEIEAPGNGGINYVNQDVADIPREAVPELLQRCNGCPELQAKSRECDYFRRQTETLSDKVERVTAALQTALGTAATLTNNFADLSRRFMDLNAAYNEVAPARNAEGPARRMERREVEAVIGCAACQLQDHQLMNCDIFPTIAGRMELLIRRNVCSICTDHYGRNCHLAPPNCNQCGGPHHVAFCQSRHRMF